MSDGFGWPAWLESWLVGRCCLSSACSGGLERAPAQWVCLHLERPTDWPACCALAPTPPCSNVSSSGLLLPASVSSGALEPLPEPRRLEGETIKFNRQGRPGEGSALSAR